MVSAADDVLVVDAADLRALGGSATRARTQIEDVARQAGAVIGGLDGRGWDLGAVRAKWAGARAQFNKLSGDLGATANDLNQRATLVDFFETGLRFGIPMSGVQLLPWLMVPGANIDGVSPVALLEWDPFWNPMLSLQAGSLLGVAGQGLPGIAPKNLQALMKSVSGNWFDRTKFGKPFGEKKYQAFVKALLGSGPIGESFARYGKLGTNAGLGKFAASLAEQAQQVANMGSPAGANHSKLTWVDKLDPKVGFNWQLLNANTSVWQWGIGDQNNYLGAQILGANAYALASANWDWKRRRFESSISLGGAANLADVYGQASEHLGNSILGERATATGEAAIGANGQAQADLNLDALKGRVSADGGVNAMAGADVSAQASGQADLAGSKVTATASGSAYLGAGFKADGGVTFDPLDGKFGIHGTLAGALGVGAGVSGSVNIDLSQAPKTVWSGVKDVGNGIADGVSSAWNDVFG